MTRARFGPAILLIVVLASCSKSPDKPVTYPVTGRVTFEGNPASGAVVMLHPANSPVAADRPRAKADAKGEFALTTFTSGDGAPAGDYTVTVEWKKADDHPEQGVDLLPSVYSDPKTSKLRATVAAGGNETLVLKLQRRP